MNINHIQTQISDHELHLQKPKINIEKENDEEIKGNIYQINVFILDLLEADTSHVEQLL
jgi:hypothetical protein